MTADRLLRFYPRAWRERYGAEFLAMIGPGALDAQQVFNIGMGAIDAWLSTDVRRSAAGISITQDSGGRAMLATLKTACGHNKALYTTRDMLISAGVLLGCTILMSGIGIVMSRSGHPIVGEALESLSFPVSATVSMPFGILKGQPWRAQTVILGVTLLILFAATYVATLI